MESRPLTLVALATLATLLVAGCAELPSSQTPAQAASRAPQVSIPTGCPVTRLRELLGEPAEVRKYETSGYKAEVWTYRRIVGKTVNYITSSTQSVMAYGGPGSVDMVPVAVPVLTREHVETEETIAFVIIDGRVASEKRFQTLHRTYE